MHESSHIDPVIKEDQKRLVLASKKTFDPNDKWSYLEIYKPNDGPNEAMYAAFKDDIWIPLLLKIENLPQCGDYVKLTYSHGPRSEPEYSAESPASHFWVIAIYQKINLTYASYCAIYEHKKDGNIENLTLRNMLRKNRHNIPEWIIHQCNTALCVGVEPITRERMQSVVVTHMEFL